MALQQAMESAGVLGKYQILHFICILGATCLPTMWFGLIIVFQGYSNKHHCRVPGNLSAIDVIPIETGPDGSQRLSQCDMYSSLGSNLTVPCTDGWQYDPEYFDEGDGTIVMEWDLVCDKGSYVELGITFRTLGSALGTILVTPLGDQIGRRKALFLCLLLLSIFSLALAFSPNFVTFCIFSLAGGVFTTGVFSCGLVLATELCPKNLYAVAIPAIGFATSVATSILFVVAYFIRGWRQLQLVTSAISFALVLYYRWCPESVRWCISKGRLDQAKALLRTQAKMNGCEFNEDSLETSTVNKSINSGPIPNGVQTISTKSDSGQANGKGNQHGIDSATVNHRSEDTSQEQRNAGSASQWQQLKVFLSTPRLLLFLGVLSYNSFIQKLNMFGLHLLQANMSGDIYIKFLINGIIGLPGNIMAIIVMRRYGRKISIIVSTLMCALHFLLSSVLTYISTTSSKDLTSYSTWLAVTAKPFISWQAATSVVVAQEISPTSIRTTSFGIQTGFGYFGTLLAPFLAISLTRVSSWLPPYLFGMISLVCAFLTRYVPETLGRGLPTTTQQIVNYPLNLTKEEMRKVRDTHRRERLFGRINAGFREDDVSENVQTNTVVIASEIMESRRF